LKRRFSGFAFEAHLSGGKALRKFTSAFGAVLPNENIKVIRTPVRVSRQRCSHFEIV